MSDDAKRSVTGAMVVKPNSDDRKPTLAVSQAGKRVIIKSADMKEDMQKEAVDIAIAVSFLSRLFIYLFISFFHLIFPLFGLIFFMGYFDVYVFE